MGIKQWGPWRAAISPQRSAAFDWTALNSNVLCGADAAPFVHLERENNENGESGDPYATCLVGFTTWRTRTLDSEFSLMCVAAIAWSAHPDYLLVAIGNRDEFHERPTRHLAKWDDGSGTIAGRDLRAGGTWLGVTEVGRFALLTNFRDPAGFKEGRPSRGRVVTDLLGGEEPAKAEEMNPFNCIIATRHEMRSFSNYPHSESHVLHPGVHGVSNGPLGTPWPKTVQLCSALESWLGARGREVNGLFGVLKVETPAPEKTPPADEPQPDFAPVFIRNPVYGTRCSTVVTVSPDGAGMIAERSFDPEGRKTREVMLEFSWSG